VSEAATFSAAAVTLATSLASGDGTADLASSIKDILPDEVVSAADAGDATPPAAFVAIVNAYVDAYEIYAALGNGVSSGEYAASADVNSGEKLSAAINGIIGYELTSFESGSLTGDALIAALWNAVVTNDSSGFSDPTALADTDPIMRLATAAGVSL
jgi:hypothetical protein